MPYPRGVGDVVRIASLAAEERFRELKLAPRGGGTGTNGQSLTEGMSVDLSRHMNGIIEIDPENRWEREGTLIASHFMRSLAPGSQS